MIWRKTHKECFVRIYDRAEILIDNIEWTTGVSRNRWIWNLNCCQVKNSFVNLNQWLLLSHFMLHQIHSFYCKTKSISIPAKKKLNSNSSIIIKDFKRYSIQINIIQHIKRKRQTEQVHWPDELCTILLSLHYIFFNFS